MAKPTGKASKDGPPGSPTMQDFQEVADHGSAFIDTTDGGNRIVSGFQEYRKTQTIHAVRMDEPYEVETLEGLHEGKEGSFLAVGAAGELYPIDAAIFAATYEEVTDER